MAKNPLGEDILKMVDKSYVITTPSSFLEKGAALCQSIIPL
jgi:hypothetical protein